MDADGPADRAAEAPHRGVAAEEWVFTAWTPDARLGVISGHRLLGRRAWYWAALAREGRPLLHVTEWDITVRPDPMIVKAEALWAEHTCEAPMQQWSIGNETYAAALDDPADALGRAYGVPTPIAADLEWYATGAPLSIAAPANGGGYEQEGVVHGTIELAGEPALELVEVPAHRWHRWGDFLEPLTPPAVVAHTGVRAPFTFPDGGVSDLVLTPAGWRSRAAGTDRAARRRPR